jgi:MFS family permease
MTRDCPRTRQALLAMNVSSEPLNALYTLLPFILYKHLNVTPFQLSLFITLRPLLAVFSFYWSSHLLYYRNKLVPNLMGAWVLARLPFLLVVFFPHFWVLFFAAMVYQLFSKAGVPAWIEIVKRNIPKKPREHLFSLYNIINFIEAFVLSFIMGRMLDVDPTSWKWLCAISAFVGLVSLFFQRRIEIPELGLPVEPPPSNRILHPLKECVQMMKQRPDFARFQWWYMVGGSALMIMAPAFSIFYTDNLQLSYSSMSIARFAFMAIGVTASSFVWKRALGRLHINQLARLALIGFALFPLLLLLAQGEMLFFYGAFFVYGIAQAGSQLIWNLSGTIFAGESDSLPFTNVNVLMNGLRGAVAPLLGGELCALFGPVSTMIVGMAVIACGMLALLKKEKPALPQKA